MTAKDHNRLLSIFFFIVGGLQVFGGIFIGLIYGGIGAKMLAGTARGEEQTVRGIIMGVGLVVELFILAVAALSLFTAWNLLKEKPLGRTLGIIMSCLSLLSIPLGTALGIYGLWFLFGEQGKRFYEAGGNSAANYPPPPPPNHWQS